LNTSLFRWQLATLFIFLFLSMSGTAPVFAQSSSAAPGVSQSAGAAPAQPQSSAAAPALPQPPGAAPLARSSGTALALPQQSAARDTLGPGDTVRITVFRYPDLTTEARVSDSGTVVFPMIGEVKVGGLSADAAGEQIARRLKDGKFLINPQVGVSLLQLRSRQVSVLGDVARPGRYALEDTSAKLTDILAMAGGMGPLAADDVTIMSNRNGKVIKSEVNLPSIMGGSQSEKNVDIQNGDTVFVPRAPVFYIYGEVQRGGVYKLEHGMNIMQAISVGGGITLRGSDRRLEVRRRTSDGQWREYSAKLADAVQPNDVIYIKESLF